MDQLDTLCIVDDDDIFQFLTQKVIRETNLVHHIKMFSNGLEAIDFLKSVRSAPEQLPEIILLDLNMPIMDGWGFLEEYILLKPHLPKQITIYIISSSISPVDIEKAKAMSEVSAFFIKPVTKDKFLDMLKGLDN